MPMPAPNARRPPRRRLAAVLAGAARAALGAAAVALAAGAAAQRAPTAAGAQPVPPLPASSPQPKTPYTTRSASLPAAGLFKGDQLTPAARERLSEFIIDAIGQHIEVALVIPTGPWDLDGTGRGERDLTPARIEVVKRFLSERGVDPRRVFVESRLDEKVKEPRLDLQLVTRPAND